MESSSEKSFQISQKHYDVYKEDMLKDKEFTDVTLATNDNKQVDAHRIILSSQSSFFNRILKENSKREILIYLPNISYEELQSLMEYIYLGQTEIGEQNLRNFLAVGKHFEVRGFEDEAINSEVLDESFIAKIEESGYKGDFLSINKPKIERQANGKFSCDQCEYESVRRNSIKRHTDAVHLGIKFQCNECQIEYSSDDQIKAHINSVHNGEFYECDQCNKKFEQPRTLHLHVKFSHEGRKTKCNECDKTFSSTSGLSYHVRKDHKGFRYPCDQCKYQAKTRSYLKIHQQAKHEDVKYSCDQCEYKSGWKSGVETHKQKKHSIL